jgi:hypothetical protein
MSPQQAWLTVLTVVLFMTKAAVHYELVSQDLSLVKKSRD